MRAAIYARKSTDQHHVTDAQKSVRRQVDQARRYAAQKRWTVAEEHVYVDDGVSGAEFARRPGFLQRMNALKPHPDFHGLVMSEESRLGREAIETAYALKQIITSGVRVFFYLEDRERRLETPTDKILLSLTTFADELERENARQRTYDALERKARAGHVTGGACFGYRNVEVVGADGRRSHVAQEVDADEAAVVRQVFELSASGRGQKAIAKQLNAEGARAPRAQQGRPRAWAPSSVRAVLFRERYRGVIVWNRTRKRDRWGQRRRVSRAEVDWIRVAAPALEIVDDALWTAAHRRLTAARQLYLKGTKGRPFGRPPVGSPSKYLLTNLAQCGLCGSSMKVRTRSHRHVRAKFYGCSGYHDRGRTVCPNGADVPMEDANLMVLEAVLDDVLTPDLVEEAVTEALRILQPDDDGEGQLAQLANEMTRVEGERSRLANAIATGGDLDGLLVAMKEREARLVQLDRHRQAVEARVARSDVGDLDRIRRELLALAADWRSLLTKQPVHARTILAKLVVGRVTFTPSTKAKQWELRGRGTVAGLFEAVFPLGMASPTGPDRLQTPIDRWFPADQPRRAARPWPSAC